MRALGLLACAAIACGGCYSPSPASGAYSCGSGGACPDGQHCTCGQCVADDSEAACAFAATATLPACADWPMSEGSPPPTCVHEHEAFPVTVRALLADKKTPAANFHGGIAVSSSWGDATLLDAAPAFSSGTATVHVSLDRETVGAVGARLTFRAGTASGVTSARVDVVAPKWTVDAQPTLMPTAWANLVVAEPDVVRAAPNDYRMYFSGAGLAPGGPVAGIGVATSTDGMRWTLGTAPLIKAGVAPWADKGVAGPAVFPASDGSWRMVFKGATTDTGAGVLGLARSPDGLSPFTLVSKNPVLQSCFVCTSLDARGNPMAQLDAPSIVAPPEGAPGSFDLYFNGYRNYGSRTVPDIRPIVGHATTDDDGLTWDADPYQVLAANSDQVILGAHTIVEGSVYKMFFALAHVSGGLGALSPNALCDGSVRVEVGYATSSDGLYWILSFGNPVVSAPAWMSGASIVPGAPLFTDASDPNQGLTLWFTTFQTVNLPLLGPTCVPNGIGRAVRP